MLSSNKLREKAWASLKGNYWTAFLACFIVSLCAYFFSSISILNINFTNHQETRSNFIENCLTNASAGSIVFYAITALLSIAVINPLIVGLSNYFINNTQNKSSLTIIFSSFKKGYSSSVVTMFLKGLKTGLWTLLFIIPGIIKSYEYAMIPFILAENPEIHYNDAFAESKKMMQGNKFRLFKLQFSFIGWYVLSILTLGIGFVFLVPYINAATAEFYMALKENVTIVD